MSTDNQARYLAPEECAAQTTWRSVTGPWIVLPEPEPLPSEEQARLDAALSARWQDWRKAVQHAGL